MADLIVIGYESKEKAEQVLDELLELNRDYLVDLQDAAVVYRNEKGKLKVISPGNPTATGALGGAFWGTLIGLIFLVPIAGLVIGGLTGALMGKGLDLGMDENFKRQVGDLVKENGTSALMFVARKMTPDKVLEELKPYGGTVLRTSLSHDDEEKLVKALQG
jgi:uncharacterized membrane protein